MAIGVQPSKKTEVTIEGMDIPDNLIGRAALQFFDETGITGRVRSGGEENPMGGGLEEDRATRRRCCWRCVLAGHKVALPQLMRHGSGVGERRAVFPGGRDGVGVRPREELYRCRRRRRGRW